MTDQEQSQSIPTHMPAMDLDSAPRTNTSSRISFARLPPTFDGSDKSKWETFLDALLNYL